MFAKRLGIAINKNYFPLSANRMTSLSEATPYHLHFVQQTFKYLSPAHLSLDSMNIELKKEIVLNHCVEAERLSRMPSRLARVDASISQSFSLEKKLGYASALRNHYDPRAVMTAHPTEVLSDQSLETIQLLVADVMALKEQKRGTVEAKILENRITDRVQQICESVSLLPQTNLTPEEEIHRQNRFYLKMMQSWPNFNERIVKHFAMAHNADKETVKRMLTPANKRVFCPRSWIVADIDGNKKKSVKSMSIMLSSLQIAIIDFYLERIQALSIQSSKLQSAEKYLQRCKASIRNNICFDVKSSERAKARFIQLLNDLLRSHQFGKYESTELANLRDLVDLIGFRGDLKQYIRQSSTANEAVFDNFTEVLKQHDEIATLLKDVDGHIRGYSELSLVEKEKFLYYLCSDSTYFSSLKESELLLSPETIREIDILSFVAKHNDLFSYILSDTKNTLSLREVMILFGFSAYRNGQLYIDQIRQAPVNLIPLCETSEDLARLPDIFKDVLDDPYLKEMIIEHGEFVYVPGPSDLGRESGEFAHVKLIQAEMILENLLDEYKKQDPRLVNVQLRALNGSGNDSQRRISQSFSQLFATFQGADASRLAGYGAYAAYVENTAAQPSENTLRAWEFKRLSENFPLENQMLTDLIARAIKAYKEYNEDPAAKALFKKLTIPELGPWLNTSSRGESKSATPKDITKSRAIGLVNYEAMTRIHIRRIMSADGLVNLSADMQAAFPILLQHSTVVRELVLKVISAIATSDIPRAWVKLQGQVPTPSQIKQWAEEFKNPHVEKQHHHVLAYLDLRAHLILQTMTLFFHPFFQQQSREYFDKHPPLTIPSHVLALELLELLGEFNQEFAELAKEIRTDLMSRYKRLEQCLDAYQQAPEPTQMMIENVVLALRGDRRIMAGPDKITNLRSDFAKSFTNLNEHLINMSEMSRRGPILT